MTQHPDSDASLRHLLAYRILDAEGQPVNWTYDYDQDEIAEEIFAHILPDAPEWRAILRRKVREIVERGVDAIFLGQTGTFISSAGWRAGRQRVGQGALLCWSRLNGDNQKEGLRK